jgi:uncharacterized protein (TIGR03118 family)
LNNTIGDFFMMSRNRFFNTDLLTATEEGTILAASLQVNRSNAVVVVNNSASGAVYKGLTLVRANIFNRSGGQVLWAADFKNGKVDVFDRSFRPIRSFTDPTIPHGFAPFNVRALNGMVFVTFAKRAAEGEDDEAGPGNGFVDVFSSSGMFLRRVASRGPLNSPWGLAISPANFGRFSNALLVGNFGDGRINAFSLSSGAFIGQLTDPNGQPITIDGLWSLNFGNGFNFVNVSGNIGNTLNVNNSLFFTAGPNEEANGLVGVIRPVR